MILAFAGRRIDPLNAPVPRFPLANVPMVRSRIRELLKQNAPSAIVSSAACGADLLALSEADALGIGCRIVLPFARDRFRATSVTDRPGVWGPLFDKMLLNAYTVVELDQAPGESAYLKANLTILDSAASLLKERDESGRVVIVWDGVSIDEHDVTQEFGIEARRRGFDVIELSTL